MTTDDRIAETRPREICALWWLDDNGVAHIELSGGEVVTMVDQPDSIRMIRVLQETSALPNPINAGIRYTRWRLGDRLTFLAEAGRS